MQIYRGIRTSQRLDRVKPKNLRYPQESKKMTINASSIITGDKIEITKIQMVLWIIPSLNIIDQ